MGLEIDNPAVAEQVHPGAAPDLSVALADAVLPDQGALRLAAADIDGSRLELADHRLQHGAVSFEQRRPSALHDAVTLVI